MKIRWHIEMRRNVLLQQGARLLAEMVDVDQAMRFVGAQLGEEFAAGAELGVSSANGNGVGEPVVNGNGVANGTGPKHHAPGRHATSVSSTKFALSDQFAWGAYSFLLLSLTPFVLAHCKMVHLSDYNASRLVRRPKRPERT